MAELLSHEETCRLVRLAQAGDREARDRLIEANMGLIHHIVLRMQLSKTYEEDLVQEGVFGLIRAIAKFDVDRGTRFSTYASRVIADYVRKARKAMMSMIRIPTYLHYPQMGERTGRAAETFAEHIAMAERASRPMLRFDAPDEPLSVADPASERRPHVEDETFEALLEAVDRLPPRLRQMIAEMFALGSGEDGMGLCEWADRHGIDRRSASSYKAFALKLLRRSMRGEPIQTPKRGARSKAS